MNFEFSKIYYLCRKIEHNAFAIAINQRIPFLWLDRKAVAIKLPVRCAGVEDPDDSAAGSPG
jgi:hypothetical protein